MASSAAESQRKQGRGVTWTYRELRELIPLWGEEGVQRELTTNHRNREIYLEISNKLREKGINRTLDEVRNKCKTLRAEYRRVTAHNRISGNAPVTCPFFREMDMFLRKDRAIFPKRVSKSLTVMRTASREGGQGTSSEAAPESPGEGPSSSAVLHLEVPPAVSEEGNRTLRLVPVDQPVLEQPADQPEYIEPQDLPASPAASDDTTISREGPVMESTCMPVEETQATVPTGSPEEAPVRRAPVRTPFRRTRTTQDIPDRRALRGELIARTLIEDSRREGRLNRTLARRQHGSLLRTIGRDASALESLARSYRRDITLNARHRQRMYRYMDNLINVCQESVEVQRNSVEEQRNRTAAIASLTAEVRSVAGAIQQLATTRPVPETQEVTGGTQILFEDSGDEGQAPSCLVPSSVPTQPPQVASQRDTGKRLIKKKKNYSPS